MTHRLIQPIFLSALLCLTLSVGGCADAPPASTDDAVQQYTCPMHPTIRLEDPNARCPLCGMELVPLEPRVDSAMEIRFTPQAVRRMNFQTFPVMRRAVTQSIRLQGRLAYDETRLAKIAAWVPGRVDRLYVDYTGMAIRKNEHMLELYSPELISAQEELLQALKSRKALPSTASALLRSSTETNAQAAREKLSLLGLSTDQIAAVIKRGTPAVTMTIRAPMAGIVTQINARKGEYVKTGTLLFTLADLSHLWLLLDAYESDIPWIHYGQTVLFSTQARPGRTFKGRVAFVSPSFDASNHTLAIRVNVDNLDGALQPGMLVHANIQAPLDRSGKALSKSLEGKWICPMHPGEINDGPGTCRICGMATVPAKTMARNTAGTTSDPPLVIPVSAVLQTGKRAVVYVRDVEAPQPTYVLREVVLGPRAGEWYVVDKGVKVGEQVVVRGAFKIDSERQLRGLPSMMSLHAEAPHAAVSPKKPTPAALPTGFRNAVGQVLDAYLSLQKALAGDDEKAAAVAAGTLRLMTQALPIDTLDATQQAVWKETTEGLGTLSAQARDAKGLTAQRETFHALSKLFLGVLRIYGTPGDKTLYLMHCPMAFNNTGASWLQPTRALRNPYFGAAMLMCGEQQQQFTPAGVSP